MTERWTAGAAQDYRWFRDRDPKIAERIDRLLADINRAMLIFLGLAG